MAGRSLTTDPLVRQAKQFAMHAHARINQRRKYTLDPYDVHLKDVAKLVAGVSDDPEMLAAAWLHDTVEDTAITHEEIEREFGPAVAGLVRELTDVSRPSDGNRRQRKAVDLAHTARISPRAKTIKLADLIDNSLDISRHDPDFAKVYLAEMSALLDVLAEGEPVLYARARKTLEACRSKLPVTLQTVQSAVVEGVTDSEAAVFSRQHGIRLFTRAFTARDIMEPILSWDRQCPATGDARTLPPPGQAVVGVREGGQVTGYFTDEDSASAADPARPFAPQQLLGLDAPLVDVIHVLTHFSFCFITLGGAVIGVIQRADIEKPVVRMWLFGMIILVEMVVVDDIRKNRPDQGWTGLISRGRLDKARQLHLEQQRRKAGGDLLDCLQFSDKLRIISQSPDFLKQSGFNSLSAAKKTFSELELLRNNLAHGQTISTCDWPSIVRLTRRIHELFQG